MQFCKNCADEIHNVQNNKVLANHEVITLSAKLEESLTCQNDGREFTHFCMECVKPLCADCIANSHNYDMGDGASRHNLISIKNAYREAIDSAKSAFED